MSWKEWWKRFDAFGRDFINNTNPILGSSRTERELLEKAKRERAFKEKKHNG